MSTYLFSYHMPENYRPGPPTSWPHGTPGSTALAESRRAHAVCQRFPHEIATGCPAHGPDARPGAADQQKSQNQQRNDQLRGRHLAA